jgi:hypothetical protein
VTARDRNRDMTPETGMVPVLGLSGFTRVAMLE